MSNYLDVVRIKLVKDAPLYSPMPLENEADVQTFMAKQLAEYDRELMVVLNLQTDHRVINMNVVSMGLVNQTLASSREMFKSAILSNATSIIMMHNHPSGRVTPSTEDILLTKKMVICGEFLDIPVIDHVIVGGRTGEIYSFQKNEMITSKQLSDSLDELNSREYYER